MFYYYYHVYFLRRNLLLPDGVQKERQRAVYTVVIYRAEDLPRMDTGMLFTPC